MERHTSEGGQTSVQGQEQVVYLAVVYTFHNFFGGGGADENVTFIPYRVGLFLWSCAWGFFPLFSQPLLSELNVAIF